MSDRDSNPGGASDEEGSIFGTNTPQPVQVMYKPYLKYSKDFSTASKVPDGNKATRPEFWDQNEEGNILNELNDEQTGVRILQELASFYVTSIFEEKSLIEIEKLYLLADIPIVEIRKAIDRIEKPFTYMLEMLKVRLSDDQIKLPNRNILTKQYFTLAIKFFAIWLRYQHLSQEIIPNGSKLNHDIHHRLNLNEAEHKVLLMLLVDLEQEMFNETVPYILHKMVDETGRKRLDTKGIYNYTAERMANIEGSKFVKEVSLRTGGLAFWKHAIGQKYLPRDIQDDIERYPFRGYHMDYRLNLDKPYGYGTRTEWHLHETPMIGETGPLGSAGDPPSPIAELSPDEILNKGKGHKGVKKSHGISLHKYGMSGDHINPSFRSKTAKELDLTSKSDKGIVLDEDSIQKIRTMLGLEEVSKQLDVASEGSKRSQNISGGMKLIESIQKYDGNSAIGARSLINKFNRLIPTEMSDEARYKLLSTKLVDLAEDSLEMTLNADPNAFMTSGENPRVSFKLFKEWILDTFGKNKSNSITQALDAASLIKQKHNEKIATYIGRCSKIFKGTQEDIPDNLQVMYAQRGLTPLNKIVARLQAPKNLLELKNVCEAHESSDTGSMSIHNFEEAGEKINPLMAVIHNILSSNETVDEEITDNVKSNRKLGNSVSTLKQNLLGKSRNIGHEDQVQEIHNIIENLGSDNTNGKLNAPLNQGFVPSQQPYSKTFNAGRFRNYGNEYDANNNYTRNTRFRNNGGYNRNSGFQNGNRNYQGGYFQSLGRPQGNNNRNDSIIRCHFCDKLGHGWKTCRVRLATESRESQERTGNIAQGGNMGNNGNRRFQGNGNYQTQRVQQGSNNGNISTMLCNYCSKPGHNYKICRSRLFKENQERGFQNNYQRVKGQPHPGKVQPNKNPSSYSTDFLDGKSQ